MIVTGIYIDENFWKQVPQLTSIEPFSSIYLADKSKTKGKSSLLMWAVASIADYDSILRNLPMKERVKQVVRDILKDKLLDYTDEVTFQNLIKTYTYLQRNSANRYLDDWDMKMEERREYIKSLEYNAENCELIDKLLINTDKLILQRDKIIQQINKEKDTSIRGNMELSMLETGELGLGDKLIKN